MVPSAIVLDVRLPGMSGLEAMAQLRQHFGGPPIIVITAYGDLETAVDVVKNGAFEYVVKPFETEQIRESITRALAANVDEGSEPIDSVAAKIDGMSGESRVMQIVFSRIALAASSDAGVLIQGESGTGKELAARAVHRYSNRADGPFVPINVAALNSSLAESEMFGHVRGAFTGAESNRDGLLKQADGGTLFLDEVGDIPAEMQVKLLRALEHGVFTPVGSSDPVESNFRIVSATNSDLVAGINSGSFRRDLYYRLSAFRIEIPPLRDRDNDAVVLAKQFAAGLGNQSLSSSAEQEIRNRVWHGNVRELRNAIEHASVVSRGGSIEPRHFPQANQWNQQTHWEGCHIRFASGWKRDWNPERTPPRLTRI
jgi:two-component system nitrogen regulation response regulator GlnG